MDNLVENVLSVQGDTLGDVLFRWLADDGDALEAEAYRINPHLKTLPVILPAGVRIRLPVIKPASSVEGVSRVWS